MNDTFRKEYKSLTDMTKTQIFFIKELAENLENELDEINNNQNLIIDKRCLALAKTNLEQAIMWAVKAIT